MASIVLVTMVCPHPPLVFFLSFRAACTTMLTDTMNGLMMLRANKQARASSACSREDV